MGKRLRILAGPNGSGKSSVYEALAQNESFHWGMFVNADEIEKKLREERDREKAKRYMESKMAALKKRFESK